MRLVSKRNIAISALVVGLALAVGVAVQATTPPPPVAQVDEVSRARALALVAAREGVPVGDLEILGAAQGSYPEQRLTLASFKIYDRVRERSHLISLDATGQEVDAEVVARRDHDLARQERGALHPPHFFETIKAAAPTDEFDVVVVVRAPSQPQPAPTGTNVTQEQIEAFLAAATERRRREVAVAIAPVIAWLEAKGVRPMGWSDSFLYVRLTAADIRELSRRPEIVSIERQARLGPP